MKSAKKPASAAKRPTTVARSPEPGQRLSAMGYVMDIGGGKVDEMELVAIMDLNAHADVHWTTRNEPLHPHEEAPAHTIARCVGEALGWRVADPIGRWRVWLLTQGQLAEQLGFTGRHIQNLEARGLPNEGSRATKLYPWPDVYAWHIVHQCNLARAKARGPIAVNTTHLSARVARAEYQLMTARDEEEAERRGH